MIKHIIREVTPEQCDFGSYFDNDGLTEVGGDYCYNIFIIPQSRNCGGFNTEEYNEVKKELEDLLDEFVDINNKSNYAHYPSVGSMLLDYRLIDNIHNTNKIKKYIDLFFECCDKPRSPYANYNDNFEAFTEEMIAKYLTLKTDKEWDTDEAVGYCQGDVVKLIYCSEPLHSGVKYYGEIWLGAAKEFAVITVDEDGEEIDSCYGYIVADCQACSDEEYKKLVCEWADIDESETRLEMIEGSKTYIKYSYRVV